MFKNVVRGIVAFACGYALSVVTDKVEDVVKKKIQERKNR